MIVCDSLISSLPASGQSFCTPSAPRRSRWFMNFAMWPKSLGACRRTKPPSVSCQKTGKMRGMQWFWDCWWVVGRLLVVLLLLLRIVFLGWNREGFKKSCSKVMFKMEVSDEMIQKMCICVCWFRIKRYDMVQAHFRGCLFCNIPKRLF